MNGKAWVEKYRPDNFTDIAGNRDSLIAIEGFILSGSIPHLLFYGEPGTGKTTAAQIIAVKLLGDNLNGNFIELNASNERGIDDMRGIVIKAIKHMPWGSNIKIIFLDEADGLTKDAQEVLRRPMEKTHSTLFILACNDLESIIKPIRSRCAIFEFKPISKEDIVKGLKRICNLEKLNVSDSQLLEIAQRSGGDMRNAVNELQKLASLNNRNTEIDRIVSQYINNSHPIKVGVS